MLSRPVHSVVSILAGSLLACTGAPPNDAGPDAIARPECNVTHAMGPHEYTFVIDELTIDDSDSPSVSHTGLNIDGLFSSPIDPNGCNHEDFTSSSDPDQNCSRVDANGTCEAAPGCMPSARCIGGVDNQLPTIANSIRYAVHPSWAQANDGFDSRASYRDRITQNRFVLLVRVSGIDDDLDDPSVTVSIVVGVPLFASGCDDVEPCRSYAVRRDSLNAGATGADDALNRFPASIVNGRLIVNPGHDASVTASLPFDPLLGQPMTFTVHAFQLRADISPFDLTNATMGGYVRGDDAFEPILQAVVAQTPGATVNSVHDVLEGIFGGLIDIPLDGICDEIVMGSTHIWGGISVGFGVHAVAAQISDTTPVADGPLPGQCGTPVGPDAGRD